MENQSLKSNSEDVEEPSKLDLDEVLVEIGQFGRYQLRTVLLTVVMVTFISWTSSEYVFTAARIPTRCLISECENPAVDLEFAPSWILNAVPGTSATFFDSCQRFANSSSIDQDGNTTCSATMFDRNSSISCDKYVYENKNTVVYDFGLACDEWRRSFIGTARTLGTLLALPITGFASDRWGRRTALAVNAGNLICIGIARYWVTTYIGFIVSEFMEGALGSGVFSSLYILLMEVVGSEYRVAVSVITSTVFSFGHFTLGLIAWQVPNWRHLTLIMYTPQLIIITYFWLISESVRWYMSKGRYKDVENVLMKIAYVNRKQLSKKSIETLRNMDVEMNRMVIKERDNEPWLVLQVFRNRPILIRCLISPVWWITMTFVYYGLSINSMNMSGDKYTNYLAVAAFEMPGYWIAFALLGRVGRKPVMITAYWICALCQIGYLFMPDGHPGVSLTIYLLGKCSISAAVTSLYLYTNELYPTKYRHSLFAFSSMMGRIGSILAPLTPAFGGNLTFVLFAGLSALSGLLVFLTPETLGCRLPDTMEEAASIGKKKEQT